MKLPRAAQSEVGTGEVELDCLASSIFVQMVLLPARSRAPDLYQNSKESLAAGKALCEDVV
jgi:hypothetical protein